MKQEHGNKSYFRRIFLVMSAATLLVVLLALFCMSAAFTKMSRAYMRDTNQHFLENAVQTVQDKEKAVRKNVFAAASAGWGAVLLSSQEIDTVLLLKTMHEWDTMVSQDQNIYSVNIYNPATQMVTTMGTNLSHVPSEKAVDPDLLEIIYKYPNNREPLARQLYATQHSAPTNVYSYVISDYRKGKLKNAIVINFAADEVYDIFVQDHDNLRTTQSNFFVITQDGQILFKAGKDKKIQQMDKESLLPIVAEYAKNGSFVQKIDGKSYLVNLYADAATHCNYINLTSYSEIDKFFGFDKIIAVSIFISIILFAMSINFLGTRLLYQPIDQLTNELKKTRFFEHNGKSKNEISAITDGIHSASLTMERLFEYKQTTLDTLQKTFLREQLLAGKYTDTEFWAQCKNKEMPLHAGQQYVLICSSWTIRQQGEDMFSADDYNAINYAILNVFEEVIGAKCNVQCVLIDPWTSIFVCAYDSLDDALAEKLQEMQNVFDEHFHLAMLCVISRTVENPVAFQARAQAIQEIMQYKKFLYATGVLDEDTLDLSKLNVGMCKEMDFEALETAIRECDIAAAQNSIEAYFAKLAGYQTHSAISSIGLFAIKFVEILRRIEKHALYEFDIAYDTLYAHLVQAENIVEAQYYSYEAAQKVVQVLTTNGRDTMSQLIGRMTGDIQKNYADVNLSSKDLANQSHVSTATLNKLFRQKNGLSIAAYIKKVRLEKAKELLCRTNFSVEQIALRVGFENTKYFYSVFKKEYGVSPLSYRIATAQTVEETQV